MVFHPHTIVPIVNGISILFRRVFFTVNFPWIFFCPSLCWTVFLFQSLVYLSRFRNCTFDRTVEVFCVSSNYTDLTSIHSTSFTPFFPSDYPLIHNFYHNSSHSMSRTSRYFACSFENS